MNFVKKLKWVLGILMIFVLIIATNLIDKRNFSRVRDSVVTIYEDRLVASDVIFEMLKAVQNKEIAVALSDSTFFEEENAKVNKDLKALILRYEQTDLTKDESKVYADFNKNLDAIIANEAELIASSFATKTQMIDRIEALKRNLYNLSKIQLNEGKRQKAISNRAFETVELLTQLEIYILVFLAIIVQIIILYRPKKTEYNEED